MAENVRDRVAGFWDAQAGSFDDEPDHGLSDRVVREAWMARLRSWLPAPPAEVADRDERFALVARSSAS